MALIGHMSTVLLMAEDTTLTHNITRQMSSAADVLVTLEWLDLEQCKFQIRSSIYETFHISLHNVNFVTVVLYVFYSTNGHLLHCEVAIKLAGRIIS